MFYFSSKSKLLSVLELNRNAAFCLLSPSLHYDWVPVLNFKITTWITLNLATGPCILGLLEVGIDNALQMLGLENGS